MALQDHAKRVDLFAVPVGMIEVDPEFNPRDMASAETLAHIDALAESIRGRGFDSDRPLLGRYADERFIVTDGHCRWAAVRKLLSEGIEIVTVPGRTEPRGTGPADRLLLTLRTPGQTLNQLEQASAIKRLLSYGWDDARIAAQLGRSRAWVSGCLDLAAAPAPIQAAVRGGEIAATEAVRIVRRSDDPEAALNGAREKAKRDGRTRIRSRDVSAATKSPEVRLTPEQRVILRFLAVWDALRAKPQLPQELLIQIEGLREVVP